MQEKEVELERIVKDKKIWKLGFKNRESAQEFVDKYYNKLKIKEKVFECSWEVIDDLD